MNSELPSFDVVGFFPQCDATTARIVLRAGVYEFADNMCLGISLYSIRDLGDSALCINRNVTIEAEVAGSVVLDAKGIGRVITVLSGAETKLVGLNITGGAANYACARLLNLP